MLMVDSAGERVRATVGCSEWILTTVKVMMTMEDVEEKDGEDDVCCGAVAVQCC